MKVFTKYKSIKNTFGECFIFHCNLDINVSLNSFHKFYITIFHSWKNTLAFHSLTPTCHRSSLLLFNKDIKINQFHFIFISFISSSYFQDFSNESINFVEHLFKPSGIFKSWNEIKTEYNLDEKMFYKGFQLLLAISNQWKRINKNTNDSMVILFTLP